MPLWLSALGTPKVLGALCWEPGPHFLLKISLSQTLYCVQGQDMDGGGYLGPGSFNRTTEQVAGTSSTQGTGGRTGGLRLGSRCQGHHLLVADVVFPQGPHLGTPLLRAHLWSWELPHRSPFNPDYLPKAPLLTAICWGWDFHRWIWGKDLGSWPPGCSCAHANGVQASQQPFFLS